MQTEDEGSCGDSVFFSFTEEKVHIFFSSIDLLVFGVILAL